MMKKVGNLIVNKDNLNETVSDILHDMTIEQLAHYASKFATRGVVTESGYELPQSANGGMDGIFGVDTDFPVPIAMGQTWNTELMDKVGNVIGTEVRGKFDFDNPNTLVFAAVSDMRGNPLCGRYYETFSEDSFLTNRMAQAMCGGIRGKDEFYLLSQPATKHYFGYQAEWNRLTSNNYFDKRTLMDEQLKGFYDAIKSGEATGVMTSFGGTNGIPNALSLYNAEIAPPTPYHLFSISDFNNDYNLSTGLGNGFDKVYVDNFQYIAALMIKAKTTSNNMLASLVSEQDFANAVLDGVLDVTRVDLENMIRPQIELWLRTGLYSQGKYPYMQLCQDAAPLNSDDAGHKEVALQTAEESIVLLKNTGGLLPVPAGGNILVTGILSNTLIKPFYAVDGIKEFEHAYLTPYEAIKEYVGGSAKVTFDDNLSLTTVYLKSEKTQKYLKVDSDGQLYASEDNTNSATLFQVIDWGQNVYSIRKAFTNEYMQCKDSNICFVKLEKTDQIPIFTYEDWNGMRAIRYGALLTYHMQQVISNVPFYEYYISMGYYLLVDDKTNQIILDGIFRKEPLDSERFAAVDAVDVNDNINFTDYDYAVVAVGIPVYMNASEGTDRPSMSIGSQEMELVNSVASKFKGRTIVLVCSEMPLDVEAIKNNPDVAAIISYAYGGQYGGWALARTIYGDSNPSARLTITWPNNISHLPPLTPEPWIDPRYTINMKETEPSSNKLTYMYQTENIMYPFGYGLSYGNFVYSDVAVGLSGDFITVSASIKNLARAGKEVVQIYAVKKSTFYGEYMPLKKLIAFTKTDVIAENETAALSLNIPLASLEQWFENINRYAIEEGEVDIVVVGTGYQSDIVTLKISGETIPPTSVFRERNVWDIAGYTDGICGSEVSKTETMMKHTFHCACESNKETGYIVIPKTVISSGIMSLRVAAAGKGTIELRLNGIDGECLGIIDVSDTGAADYQLVSRENNRIITGQESRYIEKSVAVHTEAAVADLYLVIKGAGIKIDTICLHKEIVTADWRTFQGNSENNGVFEADYNLMNGPVSEKSVQMSLSGEIWGSAGGETLTYNENGKNYIFTQYSDNADGIHMRAYDVENPEKVLWDRQLYKDIISAAQLSTPVIINDSRHGDTIYAASTQYNKVFGTFEYPLTIDAGSSNTLKVDRVILVGHYHVIKIATGLTASAPGDFSAEVILSSDQNTYVFNAYCREGVFVISLNAESAENREVIQTGVYALTVTIHNKTKKAVSANIRILIPHWELCRIRDITGKASLTRLLRSSGEAATPVKYLNGALYFGTYDSYSSYLKFLPEKYTLSRCNPNAGDGFYWGGMTQISVTGKEYLICGSDLGNIYLMDEEESFSSMGGEPVKTIPLGDYLENAGAVHSSICLSEDYVYFTSENGYLWRAETATLLDEKPKLEYLKLSGSSSSTPAVAGNYAFVGTGAKAVNGTEAGGIDIVSIAGGAFKKATAIYGIGPVTASPIVDRENDGYYIYFTTNETAGHGYCYLYKDNTASKIWETDAHYALQGMSAGDGFLAYGDGSGQLHIIK